MGGAICPNVGFRAALALFYKPGSRPEGMAAVQKTIKDAVRPPTLETTLGHMAPPKSEHVLECHLIQATF